MGRSYRGLLRAKPLYPAARTIAGVNTAAYCERSRMSTLVLPHPHVVRPGAAGPVCYVKRGVKILEVYFDAPLGNTAGVDLIRYQDWSTPVPGATVPDDMPTLRVSLEADEEDIPAQMRRRARRKVKDAAARRFIHEMHGPATSAQTEAFCDFFDRFAPLRRLPLANRERYEGLRAAGLLWLSRIADPTGNVLIWHAAYRLQGVYRLVHSPSLYLAERDSTGGLDRVFADLVSDANAHLHWSDMRAAKAAGCHTYDFGSWYEGTDPAKLHVNDFKASFGGQVVRRYSGDRGITAKGIAACYGRKWQGWLRGGR
jgi:hypothetical protein